MQRYRFGVLAALLGLAVIGGCGPDVLAELAQDNPMANLDAVDIDLLSFHAYYFELPMTVKATELPAWPKAHTAVSPADAGALAGLGAATVDRWAQNGMAVAIAYQSDWPLLRKSLQEVGARELSESAALQRNPREFVEFIANWLDGARTIFFHQAPLPPRGYSLANGDGIFRINGALTGGEPGSRTLFVSMVPIFRGTEAQQRIALDDKNMTRLISEVPIIVFEGLLLQESVREDQFICIGFAPAAPQTVGQHYLTSPDGLRQLVLLLMPEIIKAKKSTQPAPAALPMANNIP